MIFLFSSTLFALGAFPLLGSLISVYLIIISHLLLLINEIRKRQVSGVSSFVFMSIIFFGIRPIYIISENDYQLLDIFATNHSLEDITSAAWWGTVALIFFVGGSELAPRLTWRWIKRRKVRQILLYQYKVVTIRMSYLLLFAQLFTLPIMGYLSGYGRLLYGNVIGAYVYDLPMPLQAVHVTTLVLLFQRALNKKKFESIILLIVSGILFIVFTWLMRDVSAFRGFYITGIMIAGIAMLQLWKNRVSLLWIIIPILLLNPFFQYLGQVRSLQNDDLIEKNIISQIFDESSVLDTYWKFYDSRGDINIFDTFMAAKSSDPEFKPYFWSWLYVPLHLVPRFIWKDKPESGVTMDLSFTYGLPYSPGIAGFFLRDGGLYWMLLCMGFLGFTVSCSDLWVFTMQRGYLQSCLIGILSVNGLYLTRFFLWQYVYQVLYASIPCVIITWLVSRSSRARQ